MIQGSLLGPFMNRKMNWKGPLEVSPDKTHLIVPPVFTKGKGVIRKEEAFSFITETIIQMDENVVSIEWNPLLERYSAGGFHGTGFIGIDTEFRAMRGALVAAKEFNIRKLRWLCKLWIHSR